MTSNDVQDQQIKSLEKRVETLDNTINGNGQKGLKQILESTSTKVGILIWFIGLQTTAIIGGVVTLFISNMG